MKIKYLICLGLLTFLQGCSHELEYSLSTRIAIEGSVVDDKSKPLKDIPIEIYAIHSCNGFPGYEFQKTLVASSITDENGYYKAYTIQPINEVLFYIDVNKGYGLVDSIPNPRTNNFNGKQIYFTKNEIINANYTAPKASINKEVTELNIKAVINTSSGRNLYFTIKNNSNINNDLRDSLYQGFEIKAEKSLTYKLYFEKNSLITIPVIFHNPNILAFSKAISDTFNIRMDSIVKNITIKI